MSGAWSLRHSAVDRPSTKPESPTKREAGRLSRVVLDEGKAPPTDREAERLAEKIVTVGADYMGRKAAERHGAEAGPDTVAPSMHADDLANKLMKEAAREMSRADARRNDGHVFPGSDAAKAEAALAGKDKPSSPMHAVADKVRAMEFAEERLSAPHAFVGPNREEGNEGASEKKRHMRNRGEHITGGFKEDRNPDVLKE